MNITLLLIARLVLAAALGAVIGFEREWRAKEAGLRTHFLVALGSCLFMLVSQYGFDLASVSATPYVANGPESAIRVDVARVAASVVSGISFLGAGVIVLHRRFVLGLTTAATIWTTAAIGMAVGGGLYPLAVVATLLVLAGLEAGRLADRRIGRARREVRVVFSAPDDSSRTEVFRSLREVGAYVSSYSVEPHGTHVRIHLLLEATTAVSQPDFLIALLEKNPGVHTESVE
jgi:putative Mg2+ transporter-C (MgtC) family protein